MTAAAPLSDPVPQLVLAGAPRLLLQGRDLATGTRKALALALLVALEPGLRRGRAADLLWPDVDPSAGRRNLRRDLFRLRQLGLALTDGPGDSLWLPPSQPEWPLPTASPPVWLDGLDEVAGAEFAHWVDGQRARLHQRWLDHLAVQARQLESAGPARAALQAWQVLLSDGVAGPGHAEARAALQRLQPEATDPLVAPGPATAAVPATADVSRRLPFVGRQAELRAVTDALAQGRLVLIDGSPGVGKTRLALEALSALGGVLVLRCRPEDPGVPYASALRGLQTLREAAPDVALPPWVRRDLSPLLPDGSVRGHRSRDLADAADDDPQAPLRLHRAAHAAMRLLAAGNFGAVLVDDWQWADDASQALWAPPAPGVGTVTLPWVLAHRSGELPAAALQRRRQWLDEGRAIAVRVPPLSDGEAQRLLQTAASPGAADATSSALSSTLAAEVLQRSAGNPLFLIETLRHVHQRGGSLLPANVHEMIVSRARALGPVVRRVLEAASLAAEGDLRPARLAAAAGLDEVAVAHALEHASAAELLVVDGRGRYRFAHDLLAQAVADSLSRVRQAALHGQLAAALIEAGDEPAHIARHLDRAERATEAAPWHLRAAQRARQRQAWTDAVAACAAVLAADVDPALRLDAQLLLAGVRRWQSDTAAAEAVLDAATADAVRAGPERLIDLGLERAALFSDTARAAQALVELQRLEADPALRPAQRWRLLREQASALGYLGRHTESLPLLRRVLAELPPSALGDRLRVLSVLSRNAYWAGDLEQAQALIEESLVLARSLDDKATVANSLYRLGVLSRERGDVERAQELLLEAAEGARHCDQVELLRSVLSTLTTVRLNQMRLDEAEALIVEGEQAAPYWASPALEEVYDERRLLLHQRRGEIDAAWVVCRRSIERTRAMQHQHFHLASLLQAVGLALLTAETAWARRYLDEALQAHDRVGADSLQGRELAAHEVLVLQAEGRHREALRRARAWLDAALPRRLEELALVLAAAVHAALDIDQPVLAASFADQATALPVLPVQTAASVLAARLRLARRLGVKQAEVEAEARAWLARPVLPVLEAQQLRAALQPHGSR